MRVAIAGGGLAGLTAALRAAQLGARPTLLEKGARPGGSFVLSSGYVWSYKDMPAFRREAPGGDATLQRLVLEGLGPSLSWLEDAGGALLARETGNPLTFGACFDPGRTVAALVRRVEATGGEILTNHAFEALLEDDAGRVTGVLARSYGGTREYDADAVLLASGGFAADPGLVGRHIIGGPGRMLVRAHPRSTGEGFRAALGMGALASAGLEEFYGRNLPAPPAAFPPEQFVQVSQLYGRYAVAINASGERYADEGADWSETALTRATARQPGLYAYYILDAAGLEGRVRERTAKEMVEAARRTGGTVIEAASLTELADKLAERGVPRQTFLRTLKEYNAATAAGKKTSPPRTGTARPLREPPFVAVKVAPSITHTVGGLAVDAGCRVLREVDAKPIPGLYAAGVEVGGVSVGGYTSGLASALVFGKTAAESAVADGLKHSSQSAKTKS
ncbi:MAG: FAD-dependent oxidoreductase [Actinomycetota bacterium]|nr:FAD-dependent oxidoreductase [Actinomycetota bacterium]